MKEAFFLWVGKSSSWKQWKLQYLGIFYQHYKTCSSHYRLQESIMRRAIILFFRFSPQGSYTRNFADMDVNMDRVIQLRTGDSNPKVILNITAYPAPESYEWWSDGHRHVSLKHRVLSSTRNFHQVALQLGVVNHSLVGNHNHSLRIKHRVGHRVIPVVFRDGSWDDDNDINSAGKFNQILLIWESKTRKINFFFSCRLITVTETK